MKKRFLLLVLAVLVAFSGCVPSFLDVPAVAEPTSPPATTEYEPTDTADATVPDAPDESVPAAVTEPEPAVQAQFQDSWTPILNGRTLTAEHYFIYDCNAQVFLTLSGEPADPVYPASVTKLFSAYVALHYILPDEVLTAGSELELIPDDASVAGLKEGDRLTVTQLVEAMLLPSGNDATYVLATAVGRILAEDPTLEPQAAIDRFVEQMNLHGAIVGLIGTHFVTPDGMHHENHYTTPEDLVKIGILVMNHPLISQYAAVASESIVMDAERTLEWKNSNILLHPESDLYCPYTVGLKTGFTTPAGNCLLSAFRVGDREVLIGVFGCKDSYDRYAETLLLFTQAFDLQIPELPPETEPADPTE